MLSNVPQYEVSLISFDNTEVGFDLPQKKVQSLQKSFLQILQKLKLKRNRWMSGKKMSPQSGVPTSVIQMNIDPFI